MASSAAGAKDAIKDFDKHCANEIKSLGSPPDLVQQVVICVGIILGEPHKEWADCVKWIGRDTPAFVKRLHDVDAIEMSEKKLKQLAKHVTDEFTVEQVKKKSMAAALLAGWVMAFYECSGAAAADGGEGSEDLQSKYPEEWQIFCALDVDGGGTLDKDELWCKLASLGEQQATQMIDMVDLNGDGVVDFDEFVQAFQGNPQFKALVEADGGAPTATDDSAADDGAWQSRYGLNGMFSTTDAAATAAFLRKEGGEQMADVNEDSPAWTVLGQSTANPEKVCWCAYFKDKDAYTVTHKAAQEPDKGRANFTEEIMKHAVNADGGLPANMTGFTFGPMLHLETPESERSTGFAVVALRKLPDAEAAAAFVVSQQTSLVQPRNLSETGAGGPPESVEGIWLILRVAADANVVVVSAAGNGNQDLDGDDYAEFRSWGDSGSTLVGAGDSTIEHNKLSFSTHGTRVDVHAWGQNVMTAGYGVCEFEGCENGDCPRERTYTPRYSGTSSASALTAAAVTAIQSFALRSLGAPLLPQEVRDLLARTGLPQGDPEQGDIGPFIQMRRAIEELLDRSLHAPRYL